MTAARKIVSSMDPDNELYDAACDLLAAAQRLNRASRGPDLERALPATFGCLAATLGALCAASSALQAHAGATPQAELDELVAALRQADRAADAARRSSPAPRDRPRAGVI